MINWPKTTEFNKRIPKQKFYENLDISPALKRVFVEQVKGIYWANKIAPSTTNLAPGETVDEIEVFRVQLSSNVLDDAFLRQIDKQIPYHILFILEYDEKVQAWIGYKEATESGQNAFKVTAYYHTDWMPEDVLSLRMEGLNMDTVYENFVRQLMPSAGVECAECSVEQTLKEAVEQDERRRKLQKEIETLERKARTENQPKKKYELVQRIRKLKDDLTKGL